MSAATMTESAAEYFSRTRPVIEPRRDGVDAHAYRMYVATQETRIEAWRGAAEGFARAMGLDVAKFLAACGA